MNAQRRRTLLELAMLISAGSILGLLGMQAFVFAPLPSRGASAFVFSLQAAPVAALAPALLSGYTRAPFWMSLASMLYFVHGVSCVVVPSTRIFGTLEVLFSLTLFTVCLGLLRLQREA